MAGEESHDTVEDRFVQLLLAFAQGAGTLLLSTEAIASLRNIYEPRIRDSSGEWSDMLPAAVFYARALGATAAQLAAAEGRQFIEFGHFTEASSRSTVHARIDCPFC